MTAETIAPQLESDIATLLNDLAEVQDELLDVLNRKRERMAGNDVVGMSELQPREQAICEQLQACHDRRGVLLQTASEHGLPSSSLENLSAALESRGSTLGRQVREASNRMRLLRHSGLTNWVLAQRTLLHLAQLIEVIATNGQVKPTYGDQQSVGGTLVDREA